MIADLTVPGWRLDEATAQIALMHTKIHRAPYAKATMFPIALGSAREADIFFAVQTNVTIAGPSRMTEKEPKPAQRVDHPLKRRRVIGFARAGVVGDA